MKCNARNRGHGDLPQLQPGDWGGKGYCKREAGWGTDHVGRGRCRSHGGASPSGIASPHFKHGGYSSAIPAKLRDSLADSLADPELLSLREDAALLHVRMKQLLEALETGEAAQLWMVLRGQAMYMRELQDDGDQDAIMQHLERMMQTIEQGATEARAWQNIVGMVDVKRKVVESERKRMVDLQQYMTKEQVFTIYAALITAVRNRVTDPETLRLIQQDFDAVTNRTANRAATG